MGDIGVSFKGYIEKKKQILLGVALWLYLYDQLLDTTYSLNLSKQFLTSVNLLQFSGRIINLLK